MDKFLRKIVSNQQDESSAGSSAGPSSSITRPHELDPDVSEVAEVEPSEKSKPKKSYRPIPKPSWTSEFPWMEIKNDKVFCKLCNSKLSGGIFHVRRHEKNVMHLKHLAAAKNTACLKTSLSNIAKEQAMTSKIKEAELRFCAYICEHNLPFSIMDTLPDFCNDLYRDSDLSNHIKMKKKKATQLIVGVLAPAFKEEIIADLKKNYFSLIVDETTDISTKKCLVVIARFWKNEKIADKFLDLVQVESATAESLFLVLKNILDSNNIPYGNLVGFGADNASVMMGHLNGVQAKFREIIPDLFIQGCSCHSLHLCASAAAKKLPSNVEQFARDIYTYFTHSSKRTEELERCQIFANEKPHKLLYPSQTRWLSLRVSFFDSNTECQYFHNDSFQSVVNRILEHWNALTLYFQSAALEDQIPTAKCILNALNNKIYKIYFLFLSYTLDLITKLNVEFQAEHSKLPVLLERVTNVYIIILKNFIKREQLEKAKNIEEINVMNPQNYIPLEKMFFGAKVEVILQKEAVNKDDLHNFRLRGLDFYVKLCTEIKSRFRFDSSHLKFASNFSPNVALSGDVLSIASFVSIFPNLSAGIDIEQANYEWQLLSVSKNLFNNKTEDVNKFWSAVNEAKNGLGEPMFPNLMKIVRIILCLPHSSAAAERIFSQLTLLKCKTRNRLLVKTCAAILHVKDHMKYYRNGVLGWKPDPKILSYERNQIENLEVQVLE